MTEDSETFLRILPGMGWAFQDCIVNEVPTFATLSGITQNKNPSHAHATHFTMHAANCRMKVVLLPSLQFPPPSSHCPPSLSLVYRGKLQTSRWMFQLLALISAMQPSKYLPDCTNHKYLLDCKTFTTPTICCMANCTQTYPRLVV